MKLYNFIIIIAILIVSFSAKAQWTAISSGTTYNLFQIDFPDSLTGYVLGKAANNAGELLKTVDGGITWNSVLNNHKMFCFDFLNKDTGAVVSNDTIFITYNGGINWNPQLSSNFNNPHLFHMNSLTEWFIIVTQGSGYTTDGGANWVNGSTWGTIPIRPTDFQFINDTTVIGVGWYTTKSFISNDRGLHFADLSYFKPLGSGTIYSVCFPSPIIGFATGNNRILKSTDGGINYSKIDSTLGFDINCLRYIDSNNLYGVGYYGGIAKTSDGGSSWTTDVSPTTNKLNKIIFINPHTSIAIGDSGTIIMNTNIVTEIENLISNENSVTVYPNPFTYATTIEFTEVQMNTTLKITDLLGKVIKSLTFTGKQLTIEKEEMKAGIYFVQTTDNKKNVYIKKIIIR
ncbi:MAG: T9SS type A sorting domain-containing protein [Bacteroidia bacterium]